MAKYPLISVITPTYNRSKYHKQLYECFSSQTYPKKELLILDDSEEPSEFFTQLKDDRVSYTHTPSRLALGEKRNELLKKAKGDIIAHFDDDDLYAPQYLRFMAKNLGADYALITLASWFIYDKQHKTFFYWDTTYLSPLHFIVQAKHPTKTIKGIEELPESFASDTKWGYGFSYVYYRSIYPDIAFEPQDTFKEDLHFVRKIQKAGLACRSILDLEGLAIHVIHTSQTSRVFPQFILPPFILEKHFPNLFKVQST